MWDLEACILTLNTNNRLVFFFSFFTISFFFKWDNNLQFRFWNHEVLGLSNSFNFLNKVQNLVFYLAGIQNEPFFQWIRGDAHVVSWFKVTQNGWYLLLIRLGKLELREILLISLLQSPLTTREGFAPPRIIDESSTRPWHLTNSFENCKPQLLSSAWILTNQNHFKSYGHVT